MTPRAATLTAMAVSVVVVGGLVALAVPAIVAIASPSSAVPNLEGEQATSGPSAAVTETPAAVAGADVTYPDGYVEIRPGLAIPAGGAGDCTATAWFWTGADDGDTEMHAELLGALVDMGPMPYAEGTVTIAPDGAIESYTVAPGDAIYAIGDRLCAEGLTIAQYNNVPVFEIQPGQVLDLRPDPSAVWTPLPG